MAGFDWKSIVKTVAPVLGTAIGGPFGGMATKAITSALLGPDEASTGPALEAKLSAAIQNDPDALLKLKKADQDFDTRMKELDVDILQIDADDRASARTAQNTNKTWIVPILASVTTISFFLMVAWILAGEVTLDSTLLGIIIGTVGTKAEQVYNFYFGSSSGSKDKTAALSSK